VHHERKRVHLQEFARGTLEAENRDDSAKNKFTGEQKEPETTVRKEQ
jgi:hypothetical protein